MSHEASIRLIANPRLLQCAKKARPGPKPELADLDATNASQQLHASDIEASQLKTELTHNATQDGYIIAV